MKKRISIPFIVFADSIVVGVLLLATQRITLSADSNFSSPSSIKVASFSDIKIEVRAVNIKPGDFPIIHEINTIKLPSWHYDSNAIGWCQYTEEDYRKMPIMLAQMFDEQDPNEPNTTIKYSFPYVYIYDLHTDTNETTQTRMLVSYDANETTVDSTEIEFHRQGTRRFISDYILPIDDYDHKYKGKKTDSTGNIFNFVIVAEKGHVEIK